MSPQTAKQVAADTLRPQVVIGIEVYCVKCGNRLRFPGALIFSPPGKDGRVKKSHVCTACVSLLNHWMKTT